MAELIQRPIYQKPLERFSLNGCCIPGVRKMYVNIDGTFRLCERIHLDAPTIGHVNTGLDLKTVKKVYIDEYIKMITKTCSDCWAVGLCKACYTNVFEDGQMTGKTRERDCQVEKESIERMFIYYRLLMEHVPGKLKYLCDYELT